MRILFLHLSDAHLKESTKVDDINVNAIVASLTQIKGFEECVIVFSGDIVNEGKKNEYKVAEMFMGRLITGIRNKYLKEKKIYTMMVPGNHDNLLKEPNRDMAVLKSYYTDGKLEEHFEEEIQQLENFYEFSGRNGSFRYKKIIEVKKRDIGGITIKFNLINSAPFSLLGSDNGDKGMHYLPQEELNKLDYNNDVRYTISIIHHGPEWFSNKTKELLYEKIYANSDLVFVGHEHYSKNETKTVNGKNRVDISSGIALYGTKTEHGYNALILDTEKCNLKGYKFIYNGAIYKPIETPILVNNNVVFKGRNNFIHTETFKCFLMHDVGQWEGENYLNYFVFPLLEAKNINGDLKNCKVSTIDKFVELMGQKRIISIEGWSKSGKTILAKYLCNYLSQEFVPIFLEEDDFGTKDNEKIISYALENQYGKNADFDVFLQMDNDKKVLIVDRNDRIKKDRWRAFIDEIQPYFGHIILLCGVEWSVNIKDKALEELMESEVFYLKISRFFYAKRQELIQKICENYKEHKIKNVEDCAKRINDGITDQLKYFELNPEFIRQYVIYYLNYPQIRTQNDNNVFNKVFEGNIVLRISQNTSEENVSEILIALDYVAFKIHFSRLYPISTEDFEQAVNQYNIDYDNTINPKLVYDVAVKSNIIKEVRDKFAVVFCNENFLSYFVAAHLNREFNRGRCAEELSMILNNICFGINGDIVLFLSYITSNVQILNPILESIINHMDAWNDLDFDLKNINYLSKPMKPFKQKLPSSKERKQLVEEKTKMEEEFIEERQEGIESLYSYDESKINSFENKISKAINYLELVSKILPNFRHMLSGDEKKAIVTILYVYPNKLLYFMFKDIDKNYERIINDALSKHPTTKRGQLITKDMLDKSLQNQSIAFVLAIYDFIASASATGKAILELNSKFDFTQNTNYKIQNIMMEENNGNFNSMADKAEKLFKKTDLEMVKQMLRLIVRKHFLTNNIALYGNAQHIASIFFEEEEQRNLQITEAKNRFIKK